MLRRCGMRTIHFDTPLGATAETPKCRLRPKGVGEKGAGEKLNRFFSGLFPLAGTGMVCTRSVMTPPNPLFLCSFHIFLTGFFPGFDRVLSGFFSGFCQGFFLLLSGFLNNLANNLVQFSPNPSMADPLSWSLKGGTKRNGYQNA